MRGRLAAVFFLSTCLLAGSEVAWHNIQFGGFASQGYLQSSANEYLGDTSEGTWDFREYALNASWARGSWRIGAQAFGQKLGHYGRDEIKLDWGMVDYQATQWFGVRAGRVKLPRGLYNESLDVDAVRPFVLLPQSVYDNRLRDFSASFDGAMAYGNVELSGRGSIDYRIFAGKMPLDTRSGASDYFNIDAPFPNIGIGIESAHGGSLFWNTPKTGLRVGYSYSEFRDFETLRYVPFRFTNTYKTAPRYDRHLGSVEYTWGNWVVAAEGGREFVHYNLTFPGAVLYGGLFAKSSYYYLSASRRINNRVEVGGYYSFSHWSQAGWGTPVIFPVLDQGDYALSVRFNVNDHLIFKLEGHYMDGAGKIFDLPTHPQPPARRDNSWTLFAAKVTVMF